MATRKVTSSKIDSESSFFDIIKSFDKSAEILSESKTAVINDYISTGNYMLNACMTGSLFKGVPGNRITTLAGASSCGKTFLALSICREAQKKGYVPIYLDSESAIDIDFVSRIGCDPEKFIIRPVNTITETSTFLANLCKTIDEMPKDKRSKHIVVLDSLGNLTSDKELNDTLDANQKRDMTKQQEIKALFRTNAANLGRLGICMICVAHIYQSMDLFSRQIISGGTGLIYSASLTIMLNAAKLEDKENDKVAEKSGGDYTKTGVLVTASPQKSRFTIPQKVQFQIPFFKAPNPYIGIEKYLTWENSGIMEGILLSEKEYNALWQQDKDIVKTFMYNGEKMYALPKIGATAKSKKIVVAHLGEELPITELWTPKVLTTELLHKLDDEVIRPMFELPSQTSGADLDELVGNDITNEG